MNLSSLVTRTFVVAATIGLFSIFTETPSLWAQEGSGTQPAAESTTETQPQETQEWQQLKPEDSGFEIQVPGEPKYIPRDVTNPVGKPIRVEMYTTTMDKGRAVFLVGYHDVPEMPETEEKRKEILDGGIKGIMLNVVGELKSHEKIEVNENPARRFAYRGTRGGREILGQAQMVLVGQRVYQISLILSLIHI